MSYQKKTPLVAHRKGSGKTIGDNTTHGPVAGEPIQNTTRGYATDGHTKASGAGYAIDVYNAILTQQAEAAAKVAGAPAIKEDNVVCDPLNRPLNRVVGSDPVNHPSHYCQGGIECIDAIQAAVTGLSGMEAVCAGNVIKYVWRAKHKNGLEDLKKARFYLNKLILLTMRNGENE